MNNQVFTIHDMIGKQKNADIKKEEIVRLQITKEKLRSQTSVQSFDRIIEIKSRQLVSYYFPSGPMFAIPQMEFFVDGEIAIGEVSVEER